MFLSTALRQQQKSIANKFLFKGVQSRQFASNNKKYEIPTLGEYSKMFQDSGIME